MSKVGQSMQRSSILLKHYCTNGGGETCLRFSTQEKFIDVITESPKSESEKNERIKSESKNSVIVFRL